ncbi:hypothetical protein KAR91_77550, partial [Candidatus Pacearchaeota archaeon]|nr:hypothetical protein [Candidatus Pacearchaeota archaeon]
ILAFGLGWFLIFYLPVSNVYPSGYVLADRYMYLCLPGFSLGLVGILRDRPGKSITILACLVLSIFSVLTVIQNSYWHDDYALSKRAVRVSPESTGANWLRANSAFDRGEFKAAKFHFEKIISLNRFFMPAYLSLAKVEERLGHLSEALKHYEFAARYGRGDTSTKARINYLRQRINSMDKMH